jgi:hypothetical protein
MISCSVLIRAKCSIEAAVSYLLSMYRRNFIEHRAAVVIGAAFGRMDTIHRAHVHTGGVLGSNARFSDDVCHPPTPTGRISPLRAYAQ